MQNKMGGVFILSVLLFAAATGRAAREIFQTSGIQTQEVS